MIIRRKQFGENKFWIILYTPIKTIGLFEPCKLLPII